MPIPPPPSDRLPGADGIRGLACLIVLLQHASVFWVDSSAQLRGTGKYGVWLFFVLSAFLLTLRLAQRGFAPLSLLDYVLGRALRVLPLFVLACLSYYAFAIGITDDSQLRAAVSLQQGFIHLWTIPAELGFYLLLPPLTWAALALQRRRGDGALLLAALALLLAHQAIWPYWQTPADSPHTRWYLPCFICGTLAALWLPHFRRLPRQALVTPFAVLASGTLVLAIPGVRHALFGTPMSGDLLDKHLFIALLWAVLIGLAVEGHGMIGRIFCNRALSMLGRISYSTYLFHWLFLTLLARHWPGQPASLLAAIALSIGVGALGFYLGEQPLENLRKVIVRRIKARTSLATGRTES